MPYTIIIPVFNEEKSLNHLIPQLRYFYLKGHEILFVNDGSSDNTGIILKKYSYIKTIRLNKNNGKGVAIRIGLLNSKNNKIIIFDGDLELSICDISKLMILDSKNSTPYVIGYRFNEMTPFKSGLDWGNFMFTTFFNLIYKTCYKDVLCCAKSFYKDNIIQSRIRSKGFDIDIELLIHLSKNNRQKRINQIYLNYKRRSVKDGKKLKISDGWKILKRLLLMV